MNRDFDDEFNRPAENMGRSRARQGNRGPDGTPINVNRQGFHSGYEEQEDYLDHDTEMGGYDHTDRMRPGTQAGGRPFNQAQGDRTGAGGNGTAGRVPSGTGAGAVGNGSSGRVPSGAGAVGNGSSGRVPSGAGAVGNGSSGRVPSGAGAVGNGLSGRVPSGTGAGAVGNGSSGRVASGAGAVGNGSSGRVPSGAGAGVNGAAGRVPARAGTNGTPRRMPVGAGGNGASGRGSAGAGIGTPPVRVSYTAEGNGNLGRRPDGAEPYGTANRGYGGNRGNGGSGGGGGTGGPGGGGRPPGKPAASRSAAQAAKSKKRRRIIIMAVAEVLTLACIFAYAYVAKLMNSIQRPPEWNVEKVKNDVLTPEQKKHMTGYWTIAVFGVDSRDGNVNKGTNADVIMLCNINRDTGEIRLVSVFRDTYLNIGDKNNTYNKINSAYANGGPQQAVAALNRNLDLDIKDYVTFNWKAVADGINMLDGVDVEISEEEFYYINSFITETVEKTGVPSRHLKSAGLKHLDGVQAVAYGRLRLMDTDYARTERQRLIIEKAFAKAKQADLGLLNRILLMEVEQIGTNLTFTDFTNLILDLNKYYIGENGGFPFARGGMIMGKKGDCVIAQTLESNVTELHEFLYAKENYQPSNTVKKISAQIMADTGMYKKGNSVGHVATDQGKIPKETTKAEEDETTEDESDFLDASSSGRETTEVETDEFGDPIETSAAETRPGETRPGATRPTETRPGETSAGETRPGETKPTETRPGATKPNQSNPSESETSVTGPGETTSPPIVYPSPGETTTSADDITGPGGRPGTGPGESTTAYEPTTARETISEAPGGPGSTTSGANSPGGGTEGDVSIVAPPPAA